MIRQDYKIFSRGKIGTLALKNRLVRSATCEYQFGPNGEVNKTVLDIYRNLALGGVGMIITGLMAISEDAKGVPEQACIYDDVHMEQIKKIADEVHETDAETVVIAQLCHPGRQVTHENPNIGCVAPSTVNSPLLTRQARELTINEIEIIVNNFVQAIIRVKKANFDGVQLHAAHGYLLSSFLSPYTNKRHDKYGGSTRKRVTIIGEIVSKAREFVGDYPILIKLNCQDHVESGISRINFPELLSEVELSGVNGVEVSGGVWDSLTRTEEELGFVPVPIPESRTEIDDPNRQSYYYDDITDIDKKLPLILVGGHRNIESMEELMLSGKVDFLSLSRPLISEPELPNRWLNGRGSSNAKCLSCNACLVFKEQFGCELKRGLKRRIFQEEMKKSWRNSFK